MQIDNKEVQIDGSNLKIAIILPYFNETLGLELLENTREELLRNNVKNENIDVIRVAGSLEIPLACQRIAEKVKPDGIIALGIIIRGDTSHYDLVCNTTYQGLMQIQLTKNVPISFGILTCEDVKQAKERVSKQGLNKGKQVAQALLIQTTI